MRERIILGKAWGIKCFGGLQGMASLTNAPQAVEVGGGIRWVHESVVQDLPGVVQPVAQL